MTNIIGTIVNLKDFLSSDAKSITIKDERSGEEFISFVLSEDRKYSIPSFQREIRWKAENINVLLHDIKFSDRFLGNIILAEGDDNSYYIIDGQQRITVLLMLLHYIKSNWGNAISESVALTTCQLEMESFTAYSKLQENSYKLDCLTPEELKTDKYNQAERYTALWEVLSTIEELQNSDDAREIFKNLTRSTVNVILAKRDSTNYNIDYFIDVNLKGVRLDTEDIFKGYLFHTNNSAETLSLWQDLKTEAMKYEKNAGTNYKLVDMLYHYFYCDLFRDSRYVNIKFASDFCLKKDFRKTNGRNFYKGEHLIKVISDDAYIKKCLKELKDVIKIFNDIVVGSEPSDSFKKLFITDSTDKQRVDNDSIVILKGLANFLLRDNDVSLPYALVMKYFIEIMRRNTKIDNKYARQFYSVYLYSILFSHFSLKKEITEIVDILKSDEWHNIIISKLNNYFKNGKLANRKYVLQCKYIEEDSFGVSAHKAKSLAIVYNFFKFDGKNAPQCKVSARELKKYIVDKEYYSLEHFIVNDGGSFSVEGQSNNEKYPDDILKYSSSIFNYIFIPVEINGKLLGDKYIATKLQILDEKIDDIRCEYSRMVIGCAKKYFGEELPLDATGNLDIKRMKEYFGYTFKEEFVSYSNVVIGEIIQHISEIGFGAN